jgi:hypothetical protein
MNERLEIVLRLYGERCFSHFLRISWVFFPRKDKK